ncbi:glycogen debranching enzyme GlgX [Acidovorax sp. CF316]|uniref:glycogen debranching protein GlgX n=1 Tax=Acidovorax sp. CF316 TaxID=1144317 RepID=UPI00026BD41A|nr:glycogen debranching protein GlgX [Acidovorax sp. CF316]EJE50654.1 glycogen debranching enzyme GlgX [Acidovorax sp. CF316]
MKPEVHAAGPLPASTFKRLRPVRQVEPGRPWPLGATVDKLGVNFAVYSSVATRVEICLFSEHDREMERIALPCLTDDVWHGHVAGLKAGQKYGLRVDGPYQPEAGQRCNPAKLLMDPFARALDRPVRGAADQFGYELAQPDEDLVRSARDNGRTAPKCRVVRSRFDWGDDRPPRVPARDTVFYEVHAKGFTQTHPGVPDNLRGTYAGLASPAAIAHFKQLGVTSIELLPVQAFIDDHRLVEMQLANYWGYNTVAFFAPEPRYAARAGADGGVDEFKAMVKALHAAGLEVILDVVYNHTGEGNHLGPTLSLKGIDHAAYYRLTEDRRMCMDYTGTGNTVDTSSAPALQLVMDSLRYWVQEMHVDGFRFDLASALGRDAAGAYTLRAPFFAALAQDPVLSRTKLIAEPWDLGPYGYQLGGFPVGWMEWNGRYRDAVRDYWINADGSLPAFAACLCGSADMYQPRRRRPTASVNMVTVHDGFTLADLVSYNEKHNEANGEGGQDGESHNRSWNCGAEGDTEDTEVLALRERQVRNFLATLFVSHGTPLLLGGDELGRTQQGNNNGYCQDSALSWYDWERAGRHGELQAFTQALVALRRALPVVRPHTWPVDEAGLPQLVTVAWHSVWGMDMTPEEWNDPAVRCVGAVMESVAEEELSVMLLFNASDADAIFTLPAETPGRNWTLRLDTRDTRVVAVGEEAGAPTVAAGGQHTLIARSMALLTAPFTPSPPATA